MPRPLAGHGPDACVLGGIIGLIKNLLRVVARNRTGHPVVSVATTSAPSGPSVDLTLRFASDAGASKGNATIVVREEASFEVHDEGQNRTVTETAQLGVIDIALRGERGALRGSLPASAIAHLPPSFGNLQARVVWGMILRIELPGFPDYRHERPVTAAPGGEPLPDAMWALLD